MRQILVFFLFIFSATALAQKVSADHKISLSVRKTLQQLKPSDSIDLIVATTKRFSSGGYKVINAYGNNLHLRLPAALVTELGDNSVVAFIDAWHPPKEEVTTASLDLATNTVNLVHRLYPHITGEGITISIKENHFDSTDLDYVKRFIDSKLGSPNGTAHATIMATTAAGAGNSSPFGMGAAWKARLTSSSFANLLPDPDFIFQQLRISVQNHSYGTVIQSYYGVEARAYDMNAIMHPHLLHVFSSGNSGTTSNTTGPYAAVATVSNLTGNFKWSKNSIAVGAIDSFYNVASLSSRGPAPDGRIKPELVAFGQDGSSGAAALVSGMAALLQHAYQLNNGGKLPVSSLVKATLINAAKDVGNTGIDFKSGYGSLDAYNAVNTIVEGRYRVDSVGAAESRSFVINVPANTASMKLTVAWTDPAANVNAEKALVNDLDLLLKDGSGNTWRPWVLNKKPHADSLMLPAIRSRDTLNNVEQISVEFPVAGNYTIEVKGETITTGRQVFAIAYQMDTVDHFNWTFPTAIHPLQSGQSNIIRWQTNRAGTGVLEYSSNGGPWQQLSAISDARKGFYEWQVPDSFAKAVLRMRFTSGTYVSDTFTTSKTFYLHTGFNCADSFMLFWDKTAATQYQLFHLVDKFLQPAMIVSDTMVVLKKSQFSSAYFAVAPIIDGKLGLRSHALNYAGDGTGCYFKSFYLQSTIGKQANLHASLGTLHNVKSIALQRLNGGVLTISTITDPATKDFDLVDPSMIKGVNVYRLQLTLKGGEVTYSDIIYVNYFEDEQIFVYPNPVGKMELLNVASNKAGRQVLDIYSSTGMKLLQMKIKDMKHYVRFTKAGVYFLHFTDDEGNRTVKKVVVL